MDAIGLALASLVGLALGLLGGGGSILTVPIFVYVAGFDPKSAIAMSLPVVGLTSLVGAAGHWKRGNVGLRAAVLFGSIAMVGAYAGSQLAAFVSGAVQLQVLSFAMVLAALAMFRGSRSPAVGSEGADGDPRAATILLLVVAAAVGTLTGIVGIGGGFLVVPALVVLARIPMKQAVGTSLVVIAMNSAAGFAGYVGRVDIAWMYTGAFTAIAIAGILAGTALAASVPQLALKRGFAVFLLVVGSLMLYENRATMSGDTTDVAPRAAVDAADSIDTLASRGTD